MKKLTVLLILLAVAVLSFVIISMARQTSALPRVENLESRPSSSFGEVRQASDPSGKGAGNSSDFSLTAPAYQLDPDKLNPEEK